MKILLGLILFLLLLVLQYQLWIGNGGLGHKAELEYEIELQRQVNLELKERNDQVIEEIEALSNGTEGLEEIARSELGMIGEDEVFYMIPEREIPEENNEQ